MSVIGAQQAFLDLTEAVADAGFGLKTFKDVPTSQVFEALHRAGYSEVVTDGGRVMWTKPWWNTTSATSTATAGETMGQNLVSTITTEAGTAEGLVDITASSVGFTTEAASVTEGVSMIATTPKLAIVTAVASACGLAFGFDLGQWLVDQYFGDDDFDWSTDSIGGKILTYISGEKTYIDEDLANRIKDRLIDIGAFAGTDYPEPEIKTYTPPYPIIDLMSGAERYISLKGINNQSALTRISKLLSYLQSNRLDGYNNIKYEFSNNSNVQQQIIFYKDSDAPSHVKAVRGHNIDNKVWLESETKNYHYYLFVISPSDSIWHQEYDSYDNGYFGGSYYYDFNFGEPKGGISGINKQQGATFPTKNTPVTTTYPNWGANKGKVPTKDGKRTVVPLKIPEPAEGTESQDDAQSGEYSGPESRINVMIDEGRLPYTPYHIPTDDGGDTLTPVIPAVDVHETGFVSLYNPTKSQLSSFSQYLWSDNFIDNFKKLFASPMDAIIGLHMIYATPSRGADAEIVCGYAHSGVMSKTVSSQYIEIDCGSIKVNRYFGNILDYAPYTKLQVYLPFVGIVDLDTNEIMDGMLNIKYRIDVLTGSCLARLRITRGDYNAELYNFAGNCAVQLPISGGSYSGIIANAIGVAGSIGATIASGGALAPVLVGSTVSSAVNSHVNVSHSGSLGSNAGALGIMNPYLIITRPKPAEADNYSEFYGKPSNKTVKLISCSGYTRVKDVHVENIIATDNELSEIEQLLKEGVII